MKRTFLLLMAVVLMFSLASCGNSDEGNNNTTGESATSTNSDWDYISDKGKMVVGITIYEPMNYYDDNNELIGFDTEFTKAVCQKLGIKPEFKVINWNAKETELKAKNIDCIWNGLTVTDERKDNMAFTKSYLTNKQTVVINKEDKDKFTNAESLKSAMLAAEGGSAGETAITENESLKEAKLTKVDSQGKAFVELNIGNVDAIVVDYTMAFASCGKGDYKDLMIVEGIDLADEQYAIGFRIGSDMTQRVNTIIDELIEDKTLENIAVKYDSLDRYKEAVEK